MASLGFKLNAREAMAAPERRFDAENTDRAARGEPTITREEWGRQQEAEIEADNNIIHLDERRSERRRVRAPTDAQDEPEIAAATDAPDGSASPTSEATAVGARDDEFDDLRDPEGAEADRRWHNRELARQLQERGLQVIPCSDRKVPNYKHWNAPLRGVFGPGALDMYFISRGGVVGIFCNHRLVVFDIDIKNGDGLANFTTWLEGRGDVPRECPITRTPSGGFHIYFMCPDGFDLGDFIGASFLEHVDVRIEGNIISQGVILADGKTYTQEPGTPSLLDALAAGTIPMLPDSWAGDLREKDKLKSKSKNKDTHSDAEWATYVAPDLTREPNKRELAYGKKMLRVIADKIAGAARGTRDDTLYRQSFRLGTIAARRWVDPNTAQTEALDAARSCGIVRELGVAGARKKIERAFKEARDYPHDDLKDRPRYQGVGAPQKACGADDELGVLSRGMADADASSVDDDDVQDVQPEDVIVDDTTGDNFADAVLARHGLVSEIARWILNVSRRPQKRFAVAAAFVLVASASSRQFKTPTNSNVNLFVALLAGTGTGKDAPMKAIIELTVKAKIDELVGVDKFGSEQAVYDLMQRRPASFSPMNEFGDTLSALTGKNVMSHQAQVLGAIRKAYDGGMITTPHSCSRNSKILHNPAISIFGASTPEQFYKALGDTQIEDGTLNRFIAVKAPYSKKREPTGREDDPPVSLLEHISALANRSGGELCARYRTALMDNGGSTLGGAVYFVQWTDDAKHLWYDYEDDIELRMIADQKVAALATRCALNALRVATVLAIGENIDEPMIEVDHIEIGKQLVEASLENMIHGFEVHGVATEQAMLGDKIKQFIASKKCKAVTRRELVRSIRKSIKSEYMFNDALGLLVEGGEIVAIEEKPSAKGGRPTVKFRLGK